ncbi:MAG: hypothetical protein IPK74_11890 [Deltaproteobacteria bacterium]|nr:hypothetical protein [Deltaproteobacteria bacterium]
MTTLSFDAPLGDFWAQAGTWSRYSDDPIYLAGPNEVAIIQLAASFQTQTDATDHIMNLAVNLHHNGVDDEYGATYATIDASTRVGHLVAVARVPLTEGENHQFGFAMQDSVGIVLAVGTAHEVITIVRE